MTLTPSRGWTRFDTKGGGVIRFIPRLTGSQVLPRVVVLLPRFTQGGHFLPARPTRKAAATHGLGHDRCVQFCCRSYGIVVPGNGPHAVHASVTPELCRGIQPVLEVTESSPTVDVLH